MRLSSVFCSITTGMMGDGPQGCDDELGVLPSLEEHPVEKILHAIPRVTESERGVALLPLAEMDQERFQPEEAFR